MEAMWKQLTIRAIKCSDDTGIERLQEMDIARAQQNEKWAILLGALEQIRSRGAN